MARTSSASRSAPSPVAAALERLARLSGAGTAADRMGREAERIVAEWRADPATGPDMLAERLEAMRENLAAGVTNAEEQTDEIEPGDKAAIRRAAVALAGLQAALQAVTEAQA